MKSLVILKYACFIVGIALLAGSVLLFQNTRVFIAEASQAEGTVVDLAESRSEDSISYRPVVRFTTENAQVIEFIGSTGSNPPSYSRGEQVQVLYVPAEPENAKLSGFFSVWGGFSILVVIGVLMFLLGGGLIWAGRRQSQNKRYLKEHGEPVQATYQGTERNRSISVNGRNPFVVIAQWQNPATSEIHVFKSENIWFDPTQYITSDTIRVLIDKENPKKNFMDLSFLPAKA